MNCGVRICENCGKKYIASGWSQKTCSDACRKERKDIADRRNKELYKNMRKCNTKTNKNVSDIAKDAADKGMTYGEYVMKTELSVVHSLSTLPSTDGNFVSELKRATPNQIKSAIDRMESFGGKNKSRIAACKRELRKREKETDHEQ